MEIAGLTAREREVVLLVVGGLCNKGIARRLGISEGTVKVHLHNIYQKMAIANRTALAVACQRAGIGASEQGLARNNS